MRAILCFQIDIENTFFDFSLSNICQSERELLHLHTGKRILDMKYYASYRFYFYFASNCRAGWRVSNL